MNISDLPTMVDAYLECAVWSSTTDEGDPLDELAQGISSELRASAENDCTAFASDNADDLADMNAEQVGHDFWLTRNHHGAGFWDRGLGALGERLTQACRPYGEVYLYVDDDGMVQEM